MEPTTSTETHDLARRSGAGRAPGRKGAGPEIRWCRSGWLRQSVPVTEWTVLDAPAPTDASVPEAWALHGAARVSRDVELADWDHADLHYPAGYLAVELNTESYATRSLQVAIARSAQTAPTADDVVGYAKLELPRGDNEHIVYAEICVHPDHRRRGVGTALMTRVEALAAEHGRGTVISWTGQVGEPAPDRPGLAPPTGSGRLFPDDAGVTFALRHGFVLEQAERYSMLHLPVDEALLARLHDDATDRAGADYRTIAWQDRCPDTWVDQYAALRTRMSTDVPLAGLDIQETPWDPARVRDKESEHATAQMGHLVVAAEHVPSGALVAYTTVFFPYPWPEVVFQDDTLVIREHRGHRLGMLVKTELLSRLGEVRPDAKRIHTWNAEENEHMLAINVALGFTPMGVGGMWQKKT